MLKVRFETLKPSELISRKIFVADHSVEISGFFSQCGKTRNSLSLETILVISLANPCFHEIFAKKV